MNGECDRHAGSDAGGGAGDGDQDAAAGGDQSVAPGAICTAVIVDRVVEGSVREDKRDTDGVELPPPPVECELIAAPENQEPVADLASFDWGAKDVVERERLPKAELKMEVADAEYGEDVPERQRPDTQGRITTRMTVAAKATRPTCHRKLLDLPVADKIVFYNRNSVANAQAAFRHRVARRVRGYTPSIEER